MAYLDPAAEQIEVLIGRRQWNQSIVVAKARMAKLTYAIARSGEVTAVIDTEVMLYALDPAAPDECGLDLTSKGFVPKLVPLVADNKTIVTADFSTPDGHGEIVGVRYVQPADDAGWAALLARVTASPNHYMPQGKYFKKVSDELPVIFTDVIRQYLVQAVALGKYAAIC